MWVRIPPPTTTTTTDMLSPRLCLSPGPVSCAAAGQRWVTRPVNDKSRLGHKLEQTEVQRRHPVILRGGNYGAVQLCAGLGRVFVRLLSAVCISDSGSAAHVSC